MATESLSFDLYARDRASRAFTSVGRAAEQSERRISRFSTAVGNVARRAAVGFGIAAAGAAAGIVKVGVSYQDSLLTFQAATRASVGQMNQVKQAAQDLGANLTLPATSAADAAAAMTELAKGGFSVKQSMKAALGTLQLAAAAQVDGAQAAEIQAAALNQFRLGAKRATRVADILANTANAASGEITDVANALTYVGPVAKKFRIPLLATATSLGLLAKNGILSEKAGTALRGILSSLANPSAKAADALKKLGIEAFNSNGKFVGMRDLIKQLTDAQKNLTDQEFAQAAAAAFGREPLAAIGALASEGAKGFDKMAKAVGRQGGAAKVAAAKTKGLRGAFEGVRSQLETVAIQIYERVEPALSDFLRKIAAAIPGAAKAIGGFLRNVKDQVRPVVDYLSSINWRRVGTRVQRGLSATLNSAVFVAARQTATRLVDGFTTGVRTGNWRPLGQAFAEALAQAFQGAQNLTASIRALFAQVDWYQLGKDASKAAIPFIIAFTNDLAINFLKFAKEHPLDTVTFVLTLIPIGRAAKVLETVFGRLPIIGPLLRLLSNTGSRVEGAIGRFIVKPLGRIAGFIGSALLDGFRTVFPRAGTALSRELGLVGTRLGVFALNMLARGKKIVANLVGGMRSQLNLVGAQAALIISRILRPFAKAGSFLINAGRDIVLGLARGIRGAAGAVVQAAQDLAGSIPGWVKKVLHISSPSKVMHSLGVWTGLGLANGIEATRGAIDKAVKSLTDRLDKVRSRLSDLKQAAADIRRSVGDSIRSSLDIGSLRGGMGAFFDIKAAASTAKAFADALGQLVKRKFAPALIQQIAEAGPEQGLSVARSLLNLNKGQARQVNTAYAQIESAATRAGRTVAGATGLPEQIAHQRRVEDKLERLIQIAKHPRKAILELDLGDSTPKHVRHAKLSVSGAF